MAAAALIVLQVGVFLLLIPEQFADPFLRSDDYPALLGNWELYHWKTLAEGRWLNHLWHRRPVLFDSQALFAIYIIFWCLMSACLGLAIFREDRWSLRAALVAVSVALIPQAALIGGWHATLVPANALLAGYAAIVLFAPGRVAIWTLAPFVIMIFLAYTTYPFVLLAIAALGIDWRRLGWGAVLRLLVIFCASTLAALIVAYGLNWIYHGHFGFQVAPWRNPNPAESLGDLVRNLSGIGEWFAAARDVVVLVRGNVLPIGIWGLALLAAALVLRADPKAFAALAACAALSALFVVTQQAVTGISMPMRGAPMFSVIAVGLFALLLRSAETGVRAAVFALAMLPLTVPYAIQWYMEYTLRLAPYQAVTREIADRLVRVAGAEAPRQVLVSGTAYALPEGLVLQDTAALAPRLEALTGWPTAPCDPAISSWRKLLDRRAPSREPTSFSIDPRFMDWKRLGGVADECDTFRAARSAPPFYPDQGAVRWVAPGVLAVSLSAYDLRDLPP